MKHWCVWTLMAAGSIAHAGTACPADYGHRLVDWLAADQAIRSAAGGVIADERRLINAMETLGQRHARDFGALLRVCGWPDQRVWGEEAAKAAWMLAQHADDDVAFQETALRALRRAADQGAAPRRQVAYLTDRILSNRQRPQRFGTQLQAVDGRMTPLPIDDPANVDQRRAAHDLQPLSEYLSEAQRRFDAR